MRFAIIGGLALAAALPGCQFRHAADVYAMPVSEAYAKLIKVDFGPLSEGEKALRTKKTASGNGRDQVVWQQGGDIAAFACKLDLAPLPDDTAQTKVTVTCGGGGAGSGAAAGMLHNLLRNEYIERVDATLTGRPYDKQLAQGATAYRWPGDGVDGSLAKATNDALKMQSDLKKMQRDAEYTETLGDSDGSRAREPDLDLPGPSNGT